MYTINEPFKQVPCQLWPLITSKVRAIGCLKFVLVVSIGQHVTSDEITAWAPFAVLVFGALPKRLLPLC
jgi:hypothetical protein